MDARGRAWRGVDGGAGGRSWPRRRWRSARSRAGRRTGGGAGDDELDEDEDELLRSRAPMT